MPLGLLMALVCLAESPATPIQGRLSQGPGLPPSVETSGRRVMLEGDKDTLSVLTDKRMAGAEIELRGRFAASDRFTVDPFHLKAIRVVRGGKKLLITYFCEVCAIRTYTPGKCWCCQNETALDLRESDDPQ